MDLEAFGIDNLKDDMVAGCNHGFVAVVVVVSAVLAVLAELVGLAVVVA